MNKTILAVAVLMLFSLTLFAQDKGHCFAVYADKKIKIDGVCKEPFWQKAQWYAIDELYLGEAKESFSGRFKAAWRGNQIYLLVEVTDDNLTNSLADGFENYWQGDYVEVFIDEALNKSEHYQNNKAFAYHIMHTGEVIDIDNDGSPKIFSDTVKFEISKDGKKYTWEIVLNVYSEKYNPNSRKNKKALVELFSGKKLGFTVAYGDNNGAGREAFYGSNPGQGDSGYTDSERFGILELAE